MAKKQHGDIGGGVDPKDAVKVSKQGLSKAVKIFRFVIPYKWTFIVGMVFLLLSNLTTLSFPLVNWRDDQSHRRQIHLQDQ